MVEAQLSKVKALIEERGGVLLEKAVGLDAEHVIRFFFSRNIRAMSMSSSYLKDESRLFSFGRKIAQISLTSILLLQMVDLGCWLGLNFLPIDHMTSSSIGRCLVISKSTKCIFFCLQLCDGLHKDWHCP